jgi:pyruvate-formate lyase-activating enzyme
MANTSKPANFSDYPDETAAVIFTRGGNSRCPFCHNSQLLQDHFSPPDVDYK